MVLGSIPGFHQSFSASASAILFLDVGAFFLAFSLSLSLSPSLCLLYNWLSQYINSSFLLLFISSVCKLSIKRKLSFCVSRDLDEKKKTCSGSGSRVRCHTLFRMLIGSNLVGSQAIVSSSLPTNKFRYHKF